MNDETYLLGRGSDIRPIINLTWKRPAVIGISLIVIYLIYEGLKVAGRYASDMVVIENYDADRLLYLVTTTVLSLFMLISLIMLIVLVLYNFTNRQTTKLTIVVFILIFVSMIFCFINALFRFFVDILLIICYDDPIEMWLYRYYIDGILVVEWRVIPDIIFNVLLMIGLVLVSITVVSYGMKYKTARNIFESSGPLKQASFNGNDIGCREIDGLKSCKFL